MIEYLTSLADSSLIVTNIFYTFRVLIFGGGVVWYFKRFLKKRFKWSEKPAFWVSVIISAQITFWIDLNIFSIFYK